MSFEIKPSNNISFGEPLEVLQEKYQEDLKNKAIGAYPNLHVEEAVKKYKQLLRLRNYAEGETSSRKFLPDFVSISDHWMLVKNETSPRYHGPSIFNKFYLLQYIPARNPGEEGYDQELQESENTKKKMQVVLALGLIGINIVTLTLKLKNLI